MTFTPKTTQFPHQRDELEAHWGHPGRAWFWEQGTGKSKMLIDNAARLHDEGEVDLLLLFAPSGLHRNFVNRELPKHLPDDIRERGAQFYWNTEKVTQAKHKIEAVNVLKHADGLKVVGMSYDAIMTDAGRSYARSLLEQYPRCMIGADESGRIKNPEAERTKRLLKASPIVPYRRVMTGTPVSNAPWDVWSQVKFADPDFWKPHGLDSFEAMKTQFGVWEEGRQRVPIGRALSKYPPPCGHASSGACPGCRLIWESNNKVTGWFDKATGEFRSKYVIGRAGEAFLKFPVQATEHDGRKVFKNLPILRQILEPIRSRVLKRDVFKDLPPQVYTTVEYELSPRQRQAYQSISKLGFALVEGGQCTSSMALTTLLRLQQVCCGYLVLDLDLDSVDEEPKLEAFDPNPKATILGEVTQDLDHQCLIWARFRHDIDQIINVLRKQGKTFSRYDGSLTDDECAESEERFHKGDSQFFVATQSKGGEGLTLVEAKTAIHYSRRFKYTDSEQAESRPHRWGQTSSVNNIDLVAAGTVEERIVSSLVGKLDVAAAVNGDTLKAWIGDQGSLL